MSRIRQWRSHVPLAVLGLVSLVVAVHRAHGFTRHDLFFDDAWAALASRVPLSQALHMTVSTPGWTLLERWWILLSPHSSTWAQIPAYVVALVVPFALFAFLRYLTWTPWMASLTAVALAVSPAMTIYATRVKPYTLEALLTILVLWSGEKARRTPSTRSYAILGFASLVAMFLSLALATIVLATWIGLGWLSRRSKEHRWVWLRSGIISGAVTMLMVAPFALHRPNSLSANWIRRGFLANYATFNRFGHNIVVTFSTLPQMLAGFYLSLASESKPMTTSMIIVCTITLALIVGCAIFLYRHRAASWFASLTPVLFAMGIAFVLYLADFVPFGDGRTDLVLYPAFLLILGTVAYQARNSLIGNLTARGRRAVAVMLVALSATVFTHSVVSTVALYPELDLRGLYAKLKPQLLPGDVVVIPGFLSFPWAYEGLSPFHVKYRNSSWPQGFQVVSDQSNILLPHGWRFGDDALMHLAAHYHRVWYIGYTLGTWNPYVARTPARQKIPMINYTSGGLKLARWKTSWFPIYSTNVYAEPLTQAGVLPLKP